MISFLMDRIDVVIKCTLIHVKIKSKLTNLIKITRIEGYNGKYGSNSQGIDDRNWGKWYFMKDDLKMIPRNQKSSNLTLIS